jgi:hypothetical protein
MTALMVAPVTFSVSGLKSGKNLAAGLAPADVWKGALSLVPGMALAATAAAARSTSRRVTA